MTVTVKCTTLGSGTTQPYSLVVSGYISNGTCGAGPAIAPVWLPGSSAKAASLPDRPANDTAPFTIPDPTTSTQSGYTAIIIGAIAAGVFAIGGVYYLVSKRKQQKSRRQDNALLTPRK